MSDTEVKEQTEKQLRTQEEINQEYSVFAAQLGHAVFQQDLLYKMVVSLKSKMESLGNEPKRPIEPLKAV